MKIKDVQIALRRAADFIEKHPKRYHFYTVYVPKSRSLGGGPGCALGWFYYFAEPKSRGHNLYRAGLLVTDFPRYNLTFYVRLDKTGHPDWRRDAKECAAALRKFATDYCVKSRRWI